MSVDVSIEDAAGAQASAEPYQLLAFPFPPSHFKVHAFRGVEGLSRSYAFDVTVTSALVSDLDVERLALGQSAALVLRVAPAKRAIHGVIESIRSEGVRASHGGVQHRMRIVPQLSLLRHARTSRIFQEASVPEVVEQVLAMAGISTRWQLSGHYPKRRYVTQYQESTLAFVERLLAEAGIFYAFAQPLALLRSLEDLAEGALASLGPLGAVGAELGALALGLLERETVVFGDDPSAYAPLDDGSALSAVLTAAAAAGLPTEVGLGPVRIHAPSPVLTFSEVTGVQSGRWQTVKAFTPRHAVRATRAEFRDYDPERPQLGLVAREPSAAGTPSLGIGGLSASADVSLDPTKGVSAALDVSATLPQVDLEDYEHHGNFHFPDWGDAQAEATRILRARRRSAEVAKGQSRCPAISPGYRFTLEEHPISAFNREYAVTAARHRGSIVAGRELYANDFECVRADVLFPPRRRPRPHVEAALTATVVGPTGGGEEIWVDAAGRIKVQFHWDRDSRSSCWIRSMQSWGGAGWGAQFIPRVGMEVVVVFDGGDPDRPIVIGSVYNGTHPMPFAVPQDKTRSGIRTRTVGSPNGSNELSFEDAPAKEQIYVHAERDLDEVVKRNHTLVVRNDERLRVDKNRSSDVGGDARETIQGNDELTVGHDQSIHVSGSRADVITGNVDTRVSGVRTTRLEQADLVDVTGPATHRYADELTTRVEGNHVVIVGRGDRKTSSTHHVEGVLRTSSTGLLELSSDEGIVLRVGKSTLRIDKDGIQLDGAAIAAQGEKGRLSASGDGLTLSSQGAAQITCQTLVATSSGASLSMGAEFKADGSKILLNSPDQASDPAAAPPAPPTRIELVDQDGAPIPNERFVVTFADGSQRSGSLGVDGAVELDLTKGGTVVFPDLPSVSAS